MNEIRAVFETEYLAQFEGPERMGAFVVKFRDSKCKFWFGSSSFSGWEIAELSCAELAALVPSIYIKYCLELDVLGLTTKYSGYFMQKGSQSCQWVLGISLPCDSLGIRNSAGISSFQLMSQAI